MFKDEVVRRFHALYKHHQAPPHGPPEIRWFGVTCQKCPMDLWIYQEILNELRPAVVIEGGTQQGGSALFLAHMMDIIGYGAIVTIDRDASDDRPKHKRINYVTGDTLDMSTVAKVARITDELTPKLLILDDGHSCDHVFNELGLYMKLIKPGDYVIVEDTDLGGPFWGLKEWMNQNPGRLEHDPIRERLMLTQNPMGYYRCVA